MIRGSQRFGFAEKALRLWQLLRKGASHSLNELSAHRQISGSERRRDLLLKQRQRFSVVSLSLKSFRF
jgi:hypothetical protein